jgi:uncharacterized membrane protein
MAQFCVATALVVALQPPSAALPASAARVAAPPLLTPATGTRARRLVLAADGFSSAEDEAAETNGRLALLALAVAGAAETGVIAADKLGGGGAVGSLCLAGSACADVLSSPWASVNGVPLAALGALAYAAVALLAGLPLAARAAAPAAGSGGGGGGGGAALVAACGGMAGFSAALMLELALRIQQPCTLCIGSAVLSGALAAVALRTPRLTDGRTDSAVYGGGGALVGLVAAGCLYFLQSSQLDARAPPPIFAHSSPRALEVSRAITAKGGRMFGAYWCSHCIDQKETLGREAMAAPVGVAPAGSGIPYVECDADGANSEFYACKAEGIRGYPTWQVGGKLFTGEKTLDELAEIAAGRGKPDAPRPPPSE